MNGEVDEGLWAVREVIPTRVVPVNERFKIEEGNIHHVSRFIRCENGIIRIEFCNTETLSPNEVAELLQKIVYFSARNYLSYYLRNGLSKTQNGNWLNYNMNGACFRIQFIAVYVKLFFMC